MGEEARFLGCFRGVGDVESGAETRTNLRAAADEQIFQIPQVGDFADLGSLWVIDADLGTQVAF